MHTIHLIKNGKKLLMTEAQDTARSAFYVLEISSGLGRWTSFSAQLTASASLLLVPLAPPDADPVGAYGYG